MTKAPGQRLSASKSGIAAAGLGLLLGVALVTRIACAPAAPDAVVRSPDTPRALDAEAPTESAGPTDTRAAPAPASTASAQDVPAPPPDAPAPARTIPAVDRREVALLAQLERELKRDPPPEAHALLAEYRRGAGRAELIEFVQQKFPRDLPLRVTALRWIDEVRPDGAGADTRPRAPAGGGPGWVKPLEQKP
jgi:hypothetical protein